MVRETLYYNIHDILSFQINRPKCREFIKDINLPYSYFEVNHIDKPDIIFNIGKFTPQNKHCSVVDHKWYVKDDYVYCSEQIGKIKINIEIIGLETTPTTINASLNIGQFKQLLLPSVLPQYFALRPMIDFKLLLKGFVSLHAAAAANSGGAVVFPGRGGTFKTSLMMDYVRKLNYRLLGDDRVIAKGSNVFSFPVHSKLFDYRINNMKTEDYLRFDKYKYLLYQRFHKKKCNYITDKATISSIYFIIKSTEKDIKVLEISKSDVLAKTVQSHKMETISGPVIMGVSSGLYDYFAAYLYVFPRNKIAYYWDIYESILDKSLNNNKYYEIFLPRTYSKATFRKFAKLVEELEEKQCKRAAIPSII